MLRSLFPNVGTILSRITCGGSEIFLESMFIELWNLYRGMFKSLNIGFW